MSPADSARTPAPARSGSRWRDRPVTVRVPATSANLGPGYDALGLALTLHDVVTAQVTEGGLAIEVSGPGEETAAAAEQHLVVRAMRTAFAELGVQPPGIGLSCVNAIPHGFGLGSSAGAIVAGLLAARALWAGNAGQDPAGQDETRQDEDGWGHNGLMTDAGLLRLAARLEGHPDNVAACLAGGLTISWTPAAGARAVRLAPVPGLTPVVCVPGSPLSTAEARMVLPPTIAHTDAAANSARAALLIAALTRDPSLLMAGTEDFLHQRYRAPAMPATADLVGRLRTAGIPAVVSGAGPAVLAFTMAGTRHGPDAVQQIAGGAQASWRVHVLDVDRDGATVEQGQA
jgi:homoserine kinase